jgi:hypothetical protein
MRWVCIAYAIDAGVLIYSRYFEACRVALFNNSLAVFIEF